MNNYLTAVIMSIIEGLTEFLPVSSSGHLILAGELLDFQGEKAATFEVVIQLGAILAVVVLYWQRFCGLLKTNENKRFSGSYGIWLLILTTFPACIIGLLFHSIIKTYLFSSFSVLLALVTGSICMLLIARFHPPVKYTSIDQITPKMAFLIGISQCCAIWAGFSRSASTIMGGLLLGMSRSLAAEYSFIAAVPIMFAATGYDLLKSWHLFTASDLLFFGLGMLGAFLSALISIKLFLKLLAKVTLAPFAIYRLLLAAFFYLFIIK